MATETCPMCSGIGYYGQDTCACCNGSGQIDEVSVLEEWELRDKENRAKTAVLSDQEIRDRIAQRESEGKPTGQLRAAARERGIDI